MSAGFCSLDGKVALVTGASRGIGASVALGLARAGATLVINYQSNKEKAQKVLEQVKEFSRESFLCAFDVGNAEEVEKSVQEIVGKKERIDILVCNAGIARDSLIPRSSPEHFEEVFRTNLMGTINPVRSVSRSMMKNRYGRILCMSSVVGEMGNKGQSAYAASKSALFGFCKSVARELASRNVTCNVIAPGFIETEMTGELPEEAKKAYLEGIPLQRFGSGQEIASAVQFLVSEEAGYITGATLDVNGGLLMR
ncbi:MAG: beta-ketoacyl-ACP reductase [Deltaproteobacteria bacterium CG11_big_fil_rev_8_21_14_0_20_45_16]|nr:MAG: beta-ketoacyl-ACP reductase [Deltaproteobacteria bacterium CG11_big_fil_rev_8_21_14_0_20_45_16]